MRPTGRPLELKCHGIDEDASRRPARIADVVGMAGEGTNLVATDFCGFTRIKQRPRRESRPFAALLGWFTDQRLDPYRR